MTFESILEKWQPTTGSKMAQWADDIKALETEIDILAALQRAFLAAVMKMAYSSALIAGWRG